MLLVEMKSFDGMRHLRDLGISVAGGGACRR
jgi:hypothetical protein